MCPDVLNILILSEASKVFKKETTPLGTHLQNNYGQDVQIDVYHLSTHVIYM